MSALSLVLVLLIGIALPIGLLGALVRRGTRQLAVSETYAEVSRELGLDVDTRGLSLRGHLGEQRLWVGSVMVGHGPARSHVCWGVLDLERPLGLGLVLRRKGLRDRLRRPRGPRVPLAGDPLDRAVELYGDDPERVRALLDPTVRRILEGVLARWRELVVTDGSVRVHLPRPLARPAELRQLVADLRQLAVALSARRRELPPPGALAGQVEAWRRLADDLGLALEPAFPGVAGLLDGRRIRVTPVRAPEGYVAEVRLSFRPHHRTGLRLRPQEEPDGYWSVGQDIQVGDDAFDRGFVVKGWDPDLVRALLGDRVREHLVALRQAARLDVDDDRLHASQVVRDPDRLGEVVRLAARAADALGW